MSFKFPTSEIAARLVGLDGTDLQLTAYQRSFVDRAIRRLETGPILEQGEVEDIVNDTWRGLRICEEGIPPNQPPPCPTCVSPAQVHLYSAAHERQDGVEIWRCKAEHDRRLGHSDGISFTEELEPFVRGVRAAHRICDIQGIGP